MDTMSSESKEINESLEKSKSLKDLSDQELVKYYNEASYLENQCFKMLFDFRVKKNRFLSEMISRSKKNAEN